MLLAFAWPSPPVESSENIGVFCSTARLHSTTPTRNVLEVLELGYKGQIVCSTCSLFAQCNKEMVAAVERHPSES